MKHIAKLLICFMLVACSLTACNETHKISHNKKEYPVYIYKGSKWDMLQINDSIITLIPALNGSNDIKPVIVNINDFKSKEVIENMMNE